MEENKVEIVKGAGSNAKNLADTFRNYKPFKANFGEVIVLKNNGTFFVYLPQRAEYDQYIYMTDKKDNLEGWFYGAVQANNGVIPKVQEGKSLTESSVGDLPDMCYAYIESTKEIAIIRKYVGGYFPTDLDTEDMTKEQCIDYVNYQNEFLGVTEEQADEMKRLSMFTWDKEQKLNESLLDTLTDEHKLKIHISNEAIKMLQNNFDVHVVGSYDDDKFEFDITGDANEVLDAVDYIKEQVSDKFDVSQERKIRQDKQFCVQVILKTK